MGKYPKLVKISVINLTGYLFSGCQATHAVY